MSHVDEMGMEILDEAVLRATAVELGLEVREKGTYNWFGTHVGDHPLPAGFTKEQIGKCDFALGVPGRPGDYEVGVVRRPDGLKLLWDYWGDKTQGSASQELIRAIGGREGNRLRQTYSVNVQEKEARRLGYRVTRSVDAQGEISLRLRR